MAILSPEDIAYLKQAAARDHYNPDDALKVFKYESSNRPDIWGGKGNKYFGLFQAGPSERAQFGVDTQNPSARNQIDAFGKYLTARGFKPDMGLLDMYSTVNAGSPGHYNASDRPGMTVAKHVAAMGGQATPQGAIPGSAPIMDASLQPSAIPAAPGAPVSPAIASEDVAPEQYDRGAMKGLLARLMPDLNAEQQVASAEPTQMQLAPADPVKPRGRGLAFKQLKIATPSFRKNA